MIICGMDGTLIGDKRSWKATVEIRVFVDTKISGMVTILKTIKLTQL